MRKSVLILIFISFFAGCNPFAKKPLPDKRAGIPGSAQVNNYLDHAVTPQSVHCAEEDSKKAPEDKNYFHDGYAKISTNLVGRDVSYRWDESYNKSIGETLEKDFPELINGELSIEGEELADLGCGGFHLASKEDKKKFWALFLASIARAHSGFDPSFKSGTSRGLFALDPNIVGAVGGACKGKDEWDFMEPTYSFPCVLEILKQQLKTTSKLFSPVNSSKFLLSALVGNKKESFLKFFRSHASRQFSFCVPGFMPPDALINSNIEGEKVTKDCTPESVRRVHEGLDRGDQKALEEGSAQKNDSDKGLQNLDESSSLTK